MLLAALLGRCRDDLRLHARTNGRLGRIPRRLDERRAYVQAATVEVFRRLFVELQGFFVGLGDADKLVEAGAVGIAILTELVHLFPKPCMVFRPSL